MRGARITPTVVKVAAEVLLACAVLVVVTTDVLDGTPLDRWPFVVGNVVIGLVGWVRPRYAGWTLAVLFCLLSPIMLIGGASTDAPTPVVVGIIVGPIVVGALFFAAARRGSRNVEAISETPHKRLACYVGVHEFVTATAGDERFLRCKHCGKYGGTGTAWRAWSYRE